ncbi:MAG TPA: hypothetical protein IAD11_00990 [Candidatus Stercorousia faecigallinarum]|nr:hypothetical protein [Candidatus Stercorousia faecigallinarum]
MAIQKLFEIKPVQGVSNPYNITRAENNFAKNAFNFGEANPNRPNGIVQHNALGDPTKGTKLYCLG